MKINSISYFFQSSPRQQFLEASGNKMPFPACGLQGILQRFMFALCLGLEIGMHCEKNMRVGKSEWSTPLHSCMPTPQPQFS